MGHTVVFRVPLDPEDDVAIQRRGPSPELRAEFFAQIANVASTPRWRWVVLAVATLPISVGVALRMAGLQAWFGAVVVGVAALATLVASGALGASMVRAMPDDFRRGDRIGIAVARLGALWVGGAALTAASGPALAWVSLHERLTESQVTPMVVTLLVVSLGAVSLGAAVAASRPWRLSPASGAASALVLVLAPLALFAGSLPVVSTTDTVSWYTFTTGERSDRGASVPVFQCTTETVLRHRAHTERSAWLLALSPLVAIADAPVRTAGELADAAPGSLARVQAGLRSTRVGPDAFSGYCYQPTSLGVPNAVKEARYANVQPVGMAIALGELALFAGSAVVLLSRRRQP